MSKMTSINEAMQHLKDGQTVLVGGFMTNGSPLAILDAVSQSELKDLTLICNDAGFPELGIGKLIGNRQCSKLIASHIGLNREAGRQMSAGETIVELIPQGTLIEQIRSGAFGLGGILTPTGVGTLVEEGKEKVTIEEQEYLIEKALRGDVALIFADIADEIGNLIYNGSENNFNAMMAANATTTIVQARKVVPAGSLDPNQIHTPSVFVDYIIEGAE